MVINFRIFSAAAGGILLFCGISLGEQGENAQFHLTPSGFAAMEIGEIVKGGFNKKTNQTWTEPG